MKIAEIFSSIQGEGSFSGYPTVFVRLAGCNLRCTYCDTPDAWTGGTEQSVREVSDAVLRLGHTHVCITGGEPLLQGEELSLLLADLRKNDKIISIETNGTVDFRPFQANSSICMDVKCPSSGEVSDLTLLQYIRESDSVKFVIGSTEDLRYAHNVTGQILSREIFWSPVFGSDYQQIVRYILEHQIPVRFQLQLHKILGVR